MSKVTERTWRTAIRVVRRNDYNGEIVLIVPGWDSQKEIILQNTKFPPDLLPKLEANYRLYAKVNIGAENAKDLKFEDWEWNPEDTAATQLMSLEEYKKANGL